MNDRFSNHHYSVQQRRGANRFRYFVQRGRIVRPHMCCVCSALGFDDKPIEAHHLDYKRWWLVSWLCKSCHRKADHGSLELKPKHIFDYWSLVAPFLKRRSPAPRYDEVFFAGTAALDNAAINDHYDTEVPF